MITCPGFFSNNISAEGKLPSKIKRLIKGTFPHIPSYQHVLLDNLITLQPYNVNFVWVSQCSHGATQRQGNIIYRYHMHLRVFQFQAKLSCPYNNQHYNRVKYCNRCNNNLRHTFHPEYFGKFSLLYQGRHPLHFHP